MVYEIYGWVFETTKVATKEILHQRKIKEYKDFTIGQNPNALSLLAEILEIRKGLII